MYIDTNGNIVPLQGNHILILKIGGISEFYGGFSDGQYANRDLEDISVAQGFSEIRLQVDGGQSDTMSEYHGGIIDSQFMAEELFQRDMKIMEKPVIIDNARLIDVPEPNAALCPIGHFKTSSIHDTTPSDH